MAMEDFNPTTFDPTPSTADTQVASAAVEELDPNDPRLTSETLDDNAEADAYAAPPPLPDGSWRVKLKQVDVGEPKAIFAVKMAGWLNPQIPYLYTAIEASVIDPTGKYDGYKITDFWVPTVPNRSGTSPAATILRKLGVALPARFTHKELMETLLKALAGEPECGVETAWEWSCQQCGEIIKKEGKEAFSRRYNTKPKSVIGMSKFPANAKGERSPDLACQIDLTHGYSTARPRISRYLSLDELKTAKK